ncbi:MAG: response regulator transcription factor [Tissierellia bacterium]|nr:response regulator transcription factor [Tissierellia bacterium]
MKILLYDDHVLLGKSLSQLLREHKGIKDCIFVSTLDSFYETLEKEDFDIIILDINLGNGIHGLNLIDDLLKKNPLYSIVILSSYDLPIYKKSAFERGAVDYIHKSIDVEELVHRLVQVKKKKTPRLNSLPEYLTPREVEILNLLCQGIKKKDIGKKCFLSERTVYNHIQNIYDKLEVNNALEACTKARKLGYLDPFL